MAVTPGERSRPLDWLPSSGIAAERLGAAYVL